MIRRGSAEVSVSGLDDLATTMIERLDADAGELELRFAYFMNKAAPVSGEVSPMDYNVTLRIANRTWWFGALAQRRCASNKPVSLLQGNLRLRGA